MRAVLLFLVRVYQLAIRPYLPPACRYLPSCSEYATEALNRHGAALGTALTISRLLSCHPLGQSGLDPVPERVTPASLVPRLKFLAAATSPRPNHAATPPQGDSPSHG